MIPRVALLACAVCLSGTDETREAYYLTTAVLGALPFVVVGALALWIRRALRSAMRER